MKDQQIREYLENLKKRMVIEKESRKLVKNNVSNIFKIAIYEAEDIYDIISYLVSEIENKQYIWKRIEIELMWHWCEIVYLTRNNQEALKEIDARKALLEWRFAYPDKVREAKEEFFQRSAEEYVQLSYLYDTFRKEYLMKIDLTNFNIVDNHFKYINLFLRRVMEKGIYLGKRLSKLELYELANEFIGIYKDNKKLERDLHT